MTSFKPIDSKKEEFRKYLEKVGIMDVLTKALVSLYEEPEKPDDALDFLRQHLLGKSSESVELEALRLELCELKVRYAQLQEEHIDVVSKLSKYEMTEAMAKTTPSTPPHVRAPSSPNQEPTDPNQNIDDNQAFPAKDSTELTSTESATSSL
ncbi:hypothetical protein HELRODRAFT_173386 [Helobdella robusta]|uniref:c-Myc-binding protein n=1 Tax=Helobdella robusta TaxID=6412 RepID=T1F6R5_HELRO|nr:hypothetical protein HELRODRAFT_173386 [Helobdella robusta]ESO03688.1 hypothetical protein HELRODRAFT_173386 [Helobdella robusta]